MNDNKYFIVSRIRDAYIKWDWEELSTNPKITMEIVEENMDLPWNWNRLSYNVNLTWSFVCKHKEYVGTYKSNVPTRTYWNWWAISIHPNMTWEIMQANAEFPWDWEVCCLNPNVNFKVVQDNPEYSWSWSALSQNPNMTWKTVQDNPDCAWDYNSYCFNLNITKQIINDNPEKTWDVSVLAALEQNAMFPRSGVLTYGIRYRGTKMIGQNITWEEIVNEQDDQIWNWVILSKDKVITWDIVKNNPDKPWHFGALSSNPNIGWQIVKDNPSMDWSWKYLSCNPRIFDLGVDDYKLLDSVVIIQKHWRIAISNPRYKLCRNRIYRELEEKMNNFPM